MTLHFGILHQGILQGDAIGHDIAGMYRLLAEMGFKPALFGQYYDDATLHSFDCRMFDDKSLSTMNILIYHHSIHWPDGEAILENFQGSIILRYHNITPPEFFAPYSVIYERKCMEGREQTRRFVLFSERRHAFWLADSIYNADELILLGAARGRVSVVPPFHQANLRLRRKTALDGVVHLLFVGRFAPNKGHRALIRIIDSYAQYVSPHVKLDIVGAHDPELAGYNQEITEMIERLGVAEQVVIHPHISADRLEKIFEQADAFICMSEHEGFGVPLLESQFIGLPVVAAATLAVAETLGPNQCCAPYPESDHDYLFFALLIAEVTQNANVRKGIIESGYANAINRFAPDVIENAFVTAILPLLEQAA